MNRDLFWPMAVSRWPTAVIPFLGIQKNGITAVGCRVSAVGRAKRQWEAMR